MKYTALGNQLRLQLFTKKLMETVNKTSEYVVSCGIYNDEGWENVSFLCSGLTIRTSNFGRTTIFISDYAKKVGLQKILYLKLYL